MKTCISYFRMQSNESDDEGKYVNEIYDTEQELDMLRQRLQIQNPSELEGLSKDIINFAGYVDTYPKFVKIYRRVFTKISENHSSTIFNEDKIFYDLNIIENQISNAAKTELRKSISQEYE